MEAPSLLVPGAPSHSDRCGVGGGGRSCHTLCGDRDEGAQDDTWHPGIGCHRACASSAGVGFPAAKGWEWSTAVVVRSPLGDWTYSCGTRLAEHQLRTGHVPDYVLVHFAAGKRLL